MRTLPSVFAPFVNQIFDFESAQAVTLLDLQNVGDRFRRRFSCGANMDGNGLFLLEGFQSPLDDLFGQAIRTVCEVLL